MKSLSLVLKLTLSLSDSLFEKKMEDAVPPDCSFPDLLSRVTDCNVSVCSCAASRVTDCNVSVCSCAASRVTDCSVSACSCAATYTHILLLWLLFAVSLLFSPSASAARAVRLGRPRQADGGKKA